MSISTAAKPTAEFKPSYRPDIDGLRCWAVLPVVAYHAGVPGVTGGFAGVDIFFVISGFLITSLVREQILSETFALTNFYARRARRLFPALFTMLAVSSIFSWFLLMPAELEDFGESLATASAFSSNILFWSEAGYFDGPSDFKPLLHTWSLAVEEHFYLAFPALLFAIRNSSIRTLALVVVGLASISMALQLMFIDGSPDAAFFLSPTRFWELLIGAATAVALKHFNLAQSIYPLREPLAFIGAACLAYAIFGFDSDTKFPGVAAAIPCIGTALIIATGNNGGSIVNRALQWRPFLAIGLISYSLYLWHWPILVFLKHFTVRPPSNIETAAALVLSVAIAWLSWRFIERPFHTPPTQRQTKPQGVIERNKSKARIGILGVSASLIALFVTAGLSLDQLEGVPERMPAAVAQIASFADDKPPGRKLCTGKNAADIRKSGLCQIPASPNEASAKQVATTNAEYLLWGDSHAMVLVPTFAAVALTKNKTGLNATRNGCAPLLGAYRPEADPERACVEFNSAVLDVVKATSSITTVILVARWAIYLEGTRYKNESGKSLLLIDQESEAPSKAESIHVAERSLKRTIAAIKAMGKRVVIIAGVPEIGWDTPNVLAKSLWRKQAISIAPTRGEHDLRQQRVHELLSSLPNEQLLIVYPESLLCTDSICEVSNDGQPLYIDEDHLSSVGARKLSPLIEGVLANSRQADFQ